MATPPIRSQVEIDQIINRGRHSIASFGYDLMTEAHLGKQIATDEDFRDKVYRLILLRAYLKNLLDPDYGELRLYWTTSANEKTLNILLDAVASLSGAVASTPIPLVQGRRGSLFYFPSTSGVSSGGQSNSGGPAAPGGVTFQNTNISAPGEIVDTLDASGNRYAIYFVNVRGTGSGEGSRLDVLTVNWVGSNQPVVTNFRGDDSGGSTTGVTYSAAIVDGNMELTCNVPTDGWSVQGTRISFENISFQNALGPLPVGGTLGQYLKKISSVNFESEWADIAIGDIDGLSTQLVNLTNAINDEASTRATADSTLQTNITAEAATRAAADIALNDDIVAEAATRLAADSDEAATRLAADSAEAATRAAEDANLLAIVSPSAWQNINLDAGNGYVAGARTPQYAVLLGVVHLRGIISIGGSPPVGDHSVTGTGALPDPPQNFQLTSVNGAAAALATCYVQTFTAQIRAVTGTLWGGTIILDGIQYPTFS